MIETGIEFRKKREFGEIVSDSFAFLKQEYKPILKLVMIYVLPFLVLYAFALIYLQINVISKIDFTNPETLTGNIGPVYLNVFLLLTFGMFVQSMLIGTYYSYIETYIKKGKGNFEPSEVVQLLFANGQTALRSGFFWFFAVFIGAMMCFVPGVYFANLLSLVFFVSIFEKEGLNSAIKRSIMLLNGRRWSTFQLNLVGIIITWTAGLVLSIPLLLTSNPINGSSYTTLQLILTVFSTVISSVLWIIPYTFLAFQYFNLNERTEHIN